MASLDWIQAKRSTKAENWAVGGLGGCVVGAARKQEQMPFFNLQHAIELRLQRANDDMQHFCELGHG